MEVLTRQSLSFGGMENSRSPRRAAEQESKKKQLDRRAAHLTFELRVYCMNDCTTNNLHVPYVPQRPNAPCAHRWSIVLIAVVIKEFSRRSIYLILQQTFVHCRSPCLFSAYLFTQCSSLVLLYYISSAIPTHAYMYSDIGYSPGLPS